jgi:hypothetical protein
MRRLVESVEIAWDTTHDSALYYTRAHLGGRKKKWAPSLTRRRPQVCSCVVMDAYFTVTGLLVASRVPLWLAYKRTSYVPGVVGMVTAHEPEARAAPAVLVQLLSHT